MHSYKELRLACPKKIFICFSPLVMHQQVSFITMVYAVDQSGHAHWQRVVLDCKHYSHVISFCFFWLRMEIIKDTNLLRYAKKSPTSKC